MRSYLLNGRMGEGEDGRPRDPNDPVRMKTIISREPIPELTPVGTVELQGEVSNEWDLSKAEKFLAMGSAAQDAGLETGGYDFNKASAALGTGAALGAAVGSVIPGLGTAVGGAVGAIVGICAYTIGFFTRDKNKGDSWYDMPAHIRNWAFWPAEFQEYVRALDPGTVPQTKDAALYLLLQLWLAKYNYVIGYNRLPPPPGVPELYEGAMGLQRFWDKQSDGSYVTYNQFYTGVSDNTYAQFLTPGWSGIRDFYRGLGVDFDATMEARAQNSALSGSKPIAMRVTGLKYEVEAGSTMPAVLGIAVAVGIGALAWNASKPGRSSAGSEL